MVEVQRLANLPPPKSATHLPSAATSQQTNPRGIISQARARLSKQAGKGRNTPATGLRGYAMARTKGATSDKFWSEAVRLAVYREAEDDAGEIRKRLNIIADKLCKMAMDGDMQAIKEIGERLDGKAPVAIDHTSAGEPINFTAVALVPLEADDEATH